MEQTLKTQGVASKDAAPAIPVKAGVQRSKVSEAGYGRVRVAPIEITDGTIISKFNKGTAYSLFPKGMVHITNSTDKYGNYIEFIDEKTFNDCVKTFNPKLEYRDYLAGYSLRIGSTGLDLDLSVIHDRIVYEFVKRQPCIAPNKAAINSALHYFYINDEVANAKVTGIVMSHKLEAYSIINEMTPQDKRDMVRLYGVIPDSLTDELVVDALIKNVDANLSKFLSMWKDSNREYVILIKTLIQKRIFRTNGASIFYNDMSIGMNEELAIEFLKAPVNTELLFQLKKSIA